MRIIFKIILIFLILLFIVMPITFIIFGLQSDPLIKQDRKLTFEDATRVKTLLKQNDPRKLKNGERKIVTLSERDLNLFFTYAFSKTSDQQKMWAHASLDGNSAVAFYTLYMPNSPFDKYLNMTLHLSQSSSRVKIDKIKIGSLPIPGFFINSFAKLGHIVLKNNNDYQQVIETVQSVEEIHLNDESVSIAYKWQPDLLEKLRDRGRNILVTKDEQLAFQAYQEELVKVTNNIKSKRVSITEFLLPFAKLAGNRSAQNGHPVVENRAFILTLAAYSVGRDINKVIGDNNFSGNRKAKRIEITLLGRKDLALHFLVSAAITVSGGSGLANFAGLFKELNDSQGGSGFSFADLAADRAGVRFGEMASNSGGDASLLQYRLNGRLQENYFMPRIDNLPEGIQELEFKKQYKDLDSASYKMVENEIEFRLNQCMLYK